MSPALTLSHPVNQLIRRNSYFTNYAFLIPCPLMISFYFRLQKPCHVASFLCFSTICDSFTSHLDCGGCLHCSPNLLAVSLHCNQSCLSIQDTNCFQPLHRLCCCWDKSQSFPLQILHDLVHIDLFYSVVLFPVLSLPPHPTIWPEGTISYSLSSPDPCTFPPLL